MPIYFYCPSGHRLRAPTRKASQEVRLVATAFISLVVTAFMRSTDCRTRLGAGYRVNWFALGATLSRLGVRLASTLPMAQSKPPMTICWQSGLVQTSWRWPSDV